MSATRDDHLVACQGGTYAFLLIFSSRSCSFCSSVFLTSILFAPDPPFEDRSAGANPLSQEM
jgi:hypothetical protein